MRPPISTSARTQVALAMTVALATIGCGGYGKVSPKAYELATALYSIANREDSARLDVAEEQIEAAVSAGELAEHEADWLRDIVQDGRQGDWDSSGKSARRMMEDQVER